MQLEADAELICEALANITKLECQIECLEIEGLLQKSGDRLGAYIIFTFTNTNWETRQWFSKILRMYEMWAQKHKCKMRHLGSTYISVDTESVTFQISGHYAYGYLKGETGCHQLVEYSETTSIAVEVLPILDNSIDFQIPADDLKIEVSRCCGSFKRVSTWVRLIHLPTETIVDCDWEGSQSRNKVYALEIIKSRVWVINHKKKLVNSNKSQKSFLFPQLIREYAFHPSPLVKDCHTGVATTAIAEVLNGDIDLFVKAYLK